MGTRGREDVRTRVAAVGSWYHRFEIAPGITTPGINDCVTVLASLDLPKTCEGLRVLDIGTRDGFFAFELRRRGAEVVALDSAPLESTGFAVAREILQLDVPYVQEDVYDLTSERHGTFDIVLFLGILYHLPDPLRALRIVRSVCRSRLFVESFVIDNAVLRSDGSFSPLEAVAPALVGLPLMQFFPGRSLNGDPTSYWGPSSACLREMLVESGFDVESATVSGQRAVLRCRAVADLRRNCPAGMPTATG